MNTRFVLIILNLRIEKILYKSNSVEKLETGKLVLHVASSESKESVTHQVSTDDKKYEVEIKYGDFAEHLGKAAASLNEVKASSTPVTMYSFPS